MSEPRPAWADDHERLAREDWLRQHIARDARTVDWLLQQRAAGRRVAMLTRRGTVSAEWQEMAAALAQALQDVRQRRACAHRPQGWPVLSPDDRARLAKIAAKLKAAGPLESVTLRKRDARLTAAALEAAIELLTTDWAELSGNQAEQLQVPEEPPEG